MDLLLCPQTSCESLWLIKEDRLKIKISGHEVVGAVTVFYHRGRQNQQYEKVPCCSFKFLCFAQSANCPPSHSLHRVQSIGEYEGDEARGNQINDYPAKKSNVSQLLRLHNVTSSSTSQTHGLYFCCLLYDCGDHKMIIVVITVDCIINYRSDLKLSV